MTTTDTDVKHTKGPWSVSFNGADDILIFGGGDLVRSEKCVAKVKTYHRSVLEAEANARLIAAAPELLAALENIVGLWADSEQNNGLAQIMAREAQAAIARAKATT